MICGMSSGRGCIWRPQAAYSGPEYNGCAGKGNLRDCLKKRGNTFSKREHDPYSEVNEKFHMEIAKISGNAYLCQVHPAHILEGGIVHILLRQVLQTEGRRKQCIEDPNTSNSCREHIKLVEALASERSGKGKGSNVPPCRVDLQFTYYAQVGITVRY